MSKEEDRELVACPGCGMPLTWKPGRAHWVCTHGKCERIIVEEEEVGTKLSVRWLKPRKAMVRGKRDG